MNNNLLIWIVLLLVLGILGLTIYLVVEKAKSMEKFGKTPSARAAKACDPSKACKIYDADGMPSNPACICGYTQAEARNWLQKGDRCTNRSAYLKGLTKLSTPGALPLWVPFCCDKGFGLYNESWGGVPPTPCP